MLTKTSRADTAQAQVTTYTYDEEWALSYNVGRLTTSSNSAATIQYHYGPWA